MEVKGGIATLSLIVVGLFIGIFATLAMLLQGFWQIVIIILVCVAFFALTASIKRQRNWVRKSLIFVGATVLGYFLYCIFIFAFAGNLYTGEIKPMDKKDRAAVLLLSPGEMSEYNYRDMIYQISMKRRTGTGGVRWWNAPIKGLRLKQRIKGIVKTDCLDTGNILFDRLKEEIGDEFGLYNANLFGPPFIETAVVDILGDGYNRIIVLNNLLIEEPYKETTDKKILKTIKKSGIEAEVLFTFPLWNNDRIVSYYEQCILEKSRDTDPQQVGIVLIAREKCKKMRNKYPEAVNRETVFFNKIKESVMKNGYESKKVRTAYLGRGRPNVKDSAGYLLDMGIRKLIVVVAGFENSTVDTEWLLCRLLEKVRLPEHVKVEVVGPWGEEDFLIRALIDSLKRVESF